MSERKYTLLIEAIGLFLSIVVVPHYNYPKPCLPSSVREGIESLDRGEGVDGETVVNDLLARLGQAKEVRG